MLQVDAVGNLLAAHEHACWIAAASQQHRHGCNRVGYQRGFRILQPTKKTPTSAETAAAKDRDLKLERECTFQHVSLSALGKKLDVRAPLVLGQGAVCEGVGGKHCALCASAVFDRTGNVRTLTFT